MAVSPSPAARQHQHHSSIISATHLHLDHDNCLEVILVRRRAAAVEKLANAMIATKGVKHGRSTAMPLAATVPDRNSISPSFKTSKKSPEFVAQIVRSYVLSIT
jgi:hypothetical protein